MSGKPGNNYMGQIRIKGNALPMGITAKIYFLK